MSTKISGSTTSGMAIPVRYLNHNARPLQTQGTSLVHGAVNYLQAHADYYHLTKTDLDKMSFELDGKFIDEKASFRLEAQKDLMDTITYVFVQTYFGLPVWEAGISVSLLKSRKSVLSSFSSAFDEIAISKVNKDLINRPVEAAALYKSLGVSSGVSKENKTNNAAGLKIDSERSLIYRYIAEKRTVIANGNDERKPYEIGDEFVLPLPPVPDNIKEGAFYVVKEVIFNYPLPGVPGLVWRAFIEPETNTALYLRAFGSNAATGMVFIKDPITKGSGLTPSASGASLNALRDNITFQNLNAPSGGVQALTGSLVSVTAVEAPVVTAPTTTSPYNFSYNARTNNFAAANTYYHCNFLFQLILDMGFGMGYFNGTSFPVHCDHRGLSQPNTGEVAHGNGGPTDVTSAVNAHCLGNATGITSADFALADVSDITLPVTTAEIATDHLGIAVDGRVVLHELGGHGVLYCHVSSANFGFSHSAGDSVAVITNDPGSLAPDRFESFPFTFLSIPASGRRRHDRTPAAGWGWEGNIALNPFSSYDGGGYNNEQILSTTLFRLYRSIGGDAADLNMQLFASRFAVYLIFKAISSLTPTTNPQNALAFEQAMETGDASNWISTNPSETQAGGAYWKVIRWAFEKQGLFQLAGTATPNNNVGTPPPVDVYIDDDRHGEYTYQPNHWSCQDIWNRTTIGDGGGVHQDPIVGQTNYAYVRIKNRGYHAATNIVVKGFHCFPGVGLVFPNDWMAMDTPQLSAPNLAANDSTGEIVGPFNWVPSQIGHECLFFSVSAHGTNTDSTTQDISNIDSRVVGPIPEWRLVPNDNNIAQRNVAPVASSVTGLVASFANRPFWIRNSFERDVHTEVIIELPEILERNKWQLSLASEGGTSFFMKEGERKQVTLKMVAGSSFDIKGEVANQQIQVTVKQDGIVIGGMVYYVDPTMDQPNNGLGQTGKDCTKNAAALLKCLDLSKARVKSITVRKINIDIDFEEDGDC